MGLHYESLTADVRDRMLEELAIDRAANSLYLSPRLTADGLSAWPDLLADALHSGSDDSLAQELVNGGFLASHEVSHRNGNPYTKAVPSNAPKTLAEGEFNRFYLRGLARVAEATGAPIEVYRARPSTNPRPESEALIGTLLDPAQLLADLRMNKQTDTALGLPPGPLSGLSGRIPR